MSDPKTNNSKPVLYLQEIDIETNPAVKFDLELKNGDNLVRLKKENDTRTYALVPNLEILDTSEFVLTAIGDRKLSIKRHSIIRPEASITVTGQQLMDMFWKNESILSVETTFHKHSFKATFSFEPSTAAENTRDAIEKLQAEMKDYKPILSDSAIKGIDSVLGIGVVLSELNPIAKAAFGIANKTFELLKAQQKYDALVTELAGDIKAILPYAEAAIEDDIAQMVDDDFIKESVKQLYNLVGETAGYLIEYVKHGRTYRAAKSLVSQDAEKLKELAERFTKVKENFDRALDVEALRQARSINDNFVFERLKPATNSGYTEDLKCMDGTRKEILNVVMDWALSSINSPGAKQIYWIHGSPGLGKTALATSICLKLHEIGRLGGSFFCRRDDPILSKTSSVLPALIYRLVRMWTPYGKSVAHALRQDPQLDAATSSELLKKLLLGPLGSLRKRPAHCLVIMIDALDECGDDLTRTNLLMALSKVVSEAPWLRVIITSRPEQEIESFFQNTYRLDVEMICDLVETQTEDDIRLFTRRSLGSIPSVPPNWPGETTIEQIVIRSRGLFMYVTTIHKLVRNTIHRDKTLKRILEGDFKDSNKVLDDLYQQAIELAIGEMSEDYEAMRTVVGAVISVSSYRPLGDATLAALAELDQAIVTNLMDKLSSLFDRDQHHRVRARHLSILEFFTNPTTPLKFRIDVKEENGNLAIRCFKTMHKELRFNICNLETSSRFNYEVEDLQARIDQHVSDALQYSCVHWLSHVCSSDVSGSLLEHVEDILGGEKALYWLEVLSLLGKVSTAESGLHRLKPSIKSSQDPCRQLVAEMLRFVTAFYGPISSSAPHIYLSALPFSPTESIIWIKTKEMFQNLLKMKEGRLTSWPSFPLKWRGHTRGINSMAYSADSSRIISGSDDRTIRIWGAETGQTIGEPLVGHTKRVRSVCYSPNGSQIASGSYDGTIRIWDAHTSQAIGEPLVGNIDVLSICYSPDGSHIISGLDDGTIKIWDAQTGQAVGEPLVGHTKYVSSVCCSPDGSRIASGSDDTTIRIWDARTGQPIGEPLAKHTGSVSSVCYSPNGSKIVSGSEDSKIWIWDAQTGQPIGEPLVENAEWVGSVCFSPDGSHVTSGFYDGTIIIWDVQTCQTIAKPLKGHTGVVWSVCYSADGHRIASGSDDSTIRIWNAQTGEPIGEPLGGHIGSVTSICCSPNGSRIISGFNDGKIQIWDAQTGRAIGKPLEGHTGWVGPVCYSPDGSRMASGSNDKTVRIWDAQTGQPIREPLVGHTEYVTSVSYSRDGSRIISGSRDGTIRIWDVQTRQTIGKALEGDTSGVTSVCYSPDDSQITLGCESGIIKILDAQTGQAIGEPLIGHSVSVRSICYSPDGSRIISGSNDRTICIWNAQTGQTIGTPLEGHKGWVRSVCYSPDGSQIASGSDDRTIRIWDAQTGEPIGGPLVGHTSYVMSICYSPDGSRIISGSLDQTIRVFDSQNAPSFTLNTSIGTNLDVELDTSGWVRNGNELLFWVPEEYRNSLTSPALMIIPNTGRHRVVRLDMSQIAYGTSWTDIRKGA